MAINFNSFSKAVSFVLDIKKPVLIRGRHGIGKSELVYQLAEARNMPVVERRASQMTEGDLLGLPSIKGNKTTWMAPDWFLQACRKPVVLFLDEIDRATIEVRQGIFELTDSRKLNGHHLHDDTLILGAVNGGVYGSQYDVGEFDPAELDRWTVFDVEPDAKDWLDWAKDKVSSEVWNFIAENHSHLEHKDDMEPNKVYPSRRSWVRFDQCLREGNLLDSASPVIVTLGMAFIGREGAIAFNDFVANYEKVVTYKELIEDGRLHLTKDFDINDHSAMVEKIEKEKPFANADLPDSHVQNLANYFAVLPSEVALKLWVSLGTNENDDEEQSKAKAKNTIRFHAMSVKCSDGSEMTTGEVFVKLLNAK